MPRRPESACSSIRDGDSGYRVVPTPGAWTVFVDTIQLGPVPLPIQRVALLLISALALMFNNIGCSTIKGEKYTYETLPDRFIAGIRENPQTVDLTKLASATENSNIIDRGDVIEVSIAAGLNEKDTVKMFCRIQEDGFVEIPEVGRIPLAGLEMAASEAMIADQCMQQHLYRNPNVTVLMKQQRTNRITVTGAVKKPSVYEIPRGQCDLLAALTKADGLDTSAGTQIVIRNVGDSDSKRNRVAGTSQGGVDPVGHSIEMASATSDSIRVDLISATKNGTGGYQLRDGAVVYVEKRDPEPLHVLGLVNRPGRFEFPIGKEFRVMDAIALAGGVSSIAANKIFIVRRKPIDASQKTVDPENPDQIDTFIIEVTLANAKQKAKSNVRLAPGDVVSVEQTPLTVMLELFRRAGFSFGGSFPLLGTPLIP